MLSLSEDDSGLPPDRTTSIQSQFSDAGTLNSADADAEAEGTHSAFFFFFQFIVGIPPLCKGKRHNSIEK